MNNCPWCNSSAMKLQLVTNSFENSWLACRNCGATGPAVVDDALGKTACALWNVRLWYRVEPDRYTAKGTPGCPFCGKWMRVHINMYGQNAFRCEHCMACAASAERYEDARTLWCIRMGGDV